MPGSRRTFSYRLSPDAEQLDQVATKARRILGWACDGEPRIECHGISGETFGVVDINLTVTGRDQWACRQLAQDVLNHVLWGLDPTIQLDLNSVRQEPHTHRGYQHGRTKRYNTPRPPKTGSPTAEASSPEAAPDGA